MACDEAELGPEKFQEKLAQMQMDRLKSLQTMQPQGQQQQSGFLEGFVQRMQSQLGNMDEGQLEQLKRLAAARDDPDLSKEEIMDRAMRKLQV